MEGFAHGKARAKVHAPVPTPAPAPTRKATTYLRDALEGVESVDGRLRPDHLCQQPDRLSVEDAELGHHAVRPRRCQGVGCGVWTRMGRNHEWDGRDGRCEGGHELAF